MNADQYERIGQLFHAALELPRERRASFLNGACGADHELRTEVESLLAAHENAGNFVAGPATNVAEWFTRDDKFEPITGTIGAYEVISLIGRGGMGEVYLAHDTRLGRKVAVKLLQAALTHNADAARRFEQEARAASSLNHPNIITIYEIGDLGERRFMAMEFVEGQSLATLIGRPYEIAPLARMGAQLARALSVAHAAGIVHRDIKPENIMVREDGYVKVLDFGLARLAPPPSIARNDVADTSPSLLLGTPRYMSPEQARGEIVTASSDVFSLGVVLYELATGVHPFESDSPFDTLGAIASSVAPTPRRWVPEMPATLERLLLTMLEKPRAARPAAATVETELTRLAATYESTGGVPRPGARTSLRRAHNLPTQRTALVGRVNELAAIENMLVSSRARLLTLTGAGGTGKTRLAIHVADDVTSKFDAVSFVNLAPITDPQLVTSAVAAALGARESADLPLVNAIIEHLRGLGRTLLLLDNFEQVAEGAAIVMTLLDACANLQVMVTSRVALRIYGEQEFPVPPLELPAPGALFQPSSLMDCASVALFVQRATAVAPAFALTPKNAGAIVEICRRLDGLPLAIELAAARVKILPPNDLLARIERPLELLTGGARDLPERQQTLRQTIKWSFDLLSPAEQTLFRRLSVFAGGCTLEGAEAVCDTREDLGIDILDGITSLVDNSLLSQRVSEDGDTRFVLLETFREYGHERLLECGDASATERSHAAYMLVLAEEEHLGMTPAEREAWLRRCDVEHDNFRAALRHLFVTVDAEWALRLAGALFRFWEQRDHLTEGRESLARVLTMPGAGEPTRVRARALYAASVLADVQADYPVALEYAREARDIYQQFGDIQGVATTTIALAVQTQHQGKHEEATSLFGETVTLWEQLGDQTAVDLAMSNMANAAKAGGNFELARTLFERVVRSSQARGDARGVASALNGLGEVAASQGDREAARRLHHESLVGYREIDDRWGSARVLADLGELALNAGECAAADRWIREAVQAFRDLGHQRGLARQLEALAWCASGQGNDELSVALSSAAKAIRQRIGAPAKAAERERIDQTLTQARGRMSAEVYAEAWKLGETASLDRLLTADGGG